MANALATTLEQGTVRIDYATGDFQSAVRGLLAQPLLARGISAARVDEIIDAIFQREATGSTCSGPVALPHARVSGLPEIVAGLGVNPNGIYPDAAPRIMLAFVSPIEAAGEHLRFLSLVAVTFRDAALVQRIQAAATRGELLAVFTNAESPSR